MLTYEDTDYFAIDLFETLERQVALAFQHKVGAGANLYETKSVLDTFLYYTTLMDYEGNQLKEYHDPDWFLETVVKETMLPTDEEGLVCVCWKTNPINLVRDYSIIVKGEQFYKADILLRLQQIGVL